MARKDKEKEKEHVPTQRKKWVPRKKQGTESSASSTDEPKRKLADSAPAALSSGDDRRGDGSGKNSSDARNKKAKQNFGGNRRKARWDLVGRSVADAESRSKGASDAIREMSSLYSDLEKENATLSHDNEEAEKAKKQAEDSLKDMKDENDRLKGIKRDGYLQEIKEDLENFSFRFAEYTPSHWGAIEIYTRIIRFCTFFWCLLILSVNIWFYVSGDEFTLFSVPALLNSVSFQFIWSYYVKWFCVPMSVEDKKSNEYLLATWQILPFVFSLPLAPFMVELHLAVLLVGCLNFGWGVFTIVYWLWVRYSWTEVSTPLGERTVRFVPFGFKAYRRYSVVKLHEAIEGDFRPDNMAMMDNKHPIPHIAQAEYECRTGPYDEHVEKTTLWISMELFAQLATPKILTVSSTDQALAERIHRAVCSLQTVAVSRYESIKKRNIWSDTELFLFGYAQWYQMKREHVPFYRAALQ